MLCVSQVASAENSAQLTTCDNITHFYTSVEKCECRGFAAVVTEDKMFSHFLIFLELCFVAASAFQSNDGFITCGSVVKLKNNEEGVRLHSHDIKYGSGSGQQSVTAVQDGDDVNSHWQILSAIKGTCKRGEPVKCGSKIRLKHLTTGCYLHSHLFAAPITKEDQVLIIFASYLINSLCIEEFRKRGSKVIFLKEVSCFGNNESDSGDHWIVVCSNNAWLTKDAVKLKHEDTGKFLAISGKQYGRPINGQYEVVAISTTKNAALWKTAEGIFMVGSNIP
ncbi:unnamed protein product [Brugia timori]|uniref:MIR domain-containing protein n=1 Tax=Brugia timori TaxID=42155 RepID=A0A158PT47_9BILA|nr:unnamed protein product [Brugia timori]